MALALPSAPSKICCNLQSLAASMLILLKRHWQLKAGTIKMNEFALNCQFYNTVQYQRATSRTSSKTADTHYLNSFNTQLDNEKRCQPRRCHIWSAIQTRPRFKGDRHRDPTTMINGIVKGFVEICPGCAIAMDGTFSMNSEMGC